MQKIKVAKKKVLRLQNFDYSSSGAYFITICTKNRIEIFGEEAILWDGVYEIDDYAEVIGACNRR